MFDPSKTIEKIQSEIDSTLKELSKNKNFDEKIKLSQVILNLTQAQGVYLQFMADIMESGMEGQEFYDDED